MSSKKNILLISPPFSMFGGVVEFNKMLLKYSNEPIKLFELKSTSKTNVAVKLLYFLLDIVRFISCLMFASIHLVHINPSLGKTSVQRDGLFTLIAKFFNKKVFVHWHGWNPDNEYLIKTKYVNKMLFKADHIKFLSKDFKNKFVEQGFLGATSLGTTFVDNILIENLQSKPLKTEGITLLFLSTVSKNKGIYDVLDTFSELLLNKPDCKLIIAGDGPELTGVKDLVIKNNIANVEFLGFVSGEDKINAFKASDIYVFPSLYEGMPTSVLEAICMGLPVVCSPVGALPEVFENQKMGYLVGNSHDLYQKTRLLINNHDLRKTMSKYNIKTGHSRFLATHAIKNIEREYASLLEL